MKHIKKTVAIMLSLSLSLAALPASLAANDTLCALNDVNAASAVPYEDFGNTCGENLTWTFENGVLTITGTGPMYDFNLDKEHPDRESPWSEYLEDIKSVVMEEGVESVGRNAFEACYNMTDVSFPSTLKTIEKNAFANCTSLTSITLPANLENVDYESFINCIALEKVEIAEDALHFATKDGVLFDKSMTTLIYCPPAINIEEYSIPEGVVNVPTYAFNYCTNIKTVNIPASVEADFLIEEPIIEYAFTGCTALEAINVDEGNSVLSSKDGVLFNKEGTLLIRYPSSKPATEYAVPDGVETIYDFSMVESQNLASITIPASVKVLKNHALAECANLKTVELRGAEELSTSAFAGCMSLEEIFIAKTLKKVDNGAFIACDALTTVYYEGTPAEWEKIEISDYLDANDALKLAHKYFNCTGMEPTAVTGDVNEDGKIDAADSTLVLRYCVGAIELTEAQESLADMNMDGNIDAADATCILRFSVGVGEG